MVLRNIQLLNFRNYPELNLDFCQGLNYLTGLNGTGKTNLLDAIHYLSMTRSFFHLSDSQSISHGENAMMVRGEFESSDGPSEMSCSVRTGHKKVFLFNNNEYERMSDHVGVFPSVVISPSDLELATSGSESRRKFIDAIISQYDRTYLVTLIRYSEVLAQRNALLKQFAFKGLADWGLMSVWDEQLHEASIIISQKRQEFVSSFNPVFAEMYHSISGGKEKPELEYLQNVAGAGLLTKLVDSRSKDLDVQYTTSGSHKDDLDFRLNGYPLKKFASQGQLKTFVTAMKLAQYDLMVRQSAKKPVLLLDEVFDRMDNDRVDRLLQVITQPPFSQVFLTHTDYGRVQGIMDSSSIEFLILQVIGNKVLPINSQELAKSKR